MTVTDWEYCDICGYEDDWEYFTWYDGFTLCDCCYYDMLDEDDDD